MIGVFPAVMGWNSAPAMTVTIVMDHMSMIAEPGSCTVWPSHPGATVLLMPSAVRWQALRALPRAVEQTNQSPASADRSAARDVDVYRRYAPSTCLDPNGAHSARRCCGLPRLEHQLIAGGNDCCPGENPRATRRMQERRTTPLREPHRESKNRRSDQEDHRDRGRPPDHLTQPVRDPLGASCGDQIGPVSRARAASPGKIGQQRRGSFHPCRTTSRPP